MLELVKGQTRLHIFREQTDDLGLQRAPIRAQALQALKRLGAAASLKARVCLATELLPAQPPRGLVPERLVRDAIDPAQIALAQGPFEPTNFVD
jgi:hypothetical protein